MEKVDKVEFNSVLENFLNSVEFDNELQLMFFRKSELEEAIKPLFNVNSPRFKRNYEHGLDIAIHYITSDAGWEKVTLEGIDEPCYKYRYEK